MGIELHEDNDKGAPSPTKKAPSKSELKRQAAQTQAEADERFLPASALDVLHALENDQAYRAAVHEALHKKG